MALFEIDESSGLPVWVQLRNRFVYLIKTGHYQPGDQLPSVRTLAAEAAINYNTVSKVYVNLESDGYVESVRGRGVFVRDIGARAAPVAPPASRNTILTSTVAPPKTGRLFSRPSSLWWCSPACSWAGSR